MRRAQAQRAQRALIAVSVPAPVGGWNARDPLANMNPEDAVRLENWFPRVSDCALRGGVADHVTGFSARPKTLGLYTPPTGSKKMFAATDGGIFEVTSAGSVGASVLSRTNGYHVTVQMGVSGGHYLMMFNGVDRPAYFDGTTWTAVDAVSTPAITGVTTTTLVSANIFKRRLFLIQTGKMSFWYLPVDAVGGAATEFTLGPLCRKGGFLSAMGTWTVDAGNGPDDYAVFVTSEGEVIVFAGTDPGVSSSWVLVGVYDLFAKPIGRRCVLKYGGDLTIITTAGVLPLGKVVGAGGKPTLALTNKIESAFTAQARISASSEGWEGIVYPGQNAFIVNVPTSSAYEQYVMNTITGQWCKFTGWAASAWALFNEEIYFADATKVSKAWTGRDDYDANIVAIGQTAFNYFGKRTKAKRWTLYRPQLMSDGAVDYSIALAVDFQQITSLVTVSGGGVSGSLWDVALWDQGSWVGTLEATRQWRTPPSQMGYCAAMVLQVATKALEVQWLAQEYAYEEGGILG